MKWDCARSLKVLRPSRCVWHWFDSVVRSVKAGCGQQRSTKTLSESGSAAMRMKQADRKAVKMKREESRLRQSTSTAQGEQQQGVSNATRERVEQSCRNAGLSSWQAVVTACQCGAVF